MRFAARRIVATAVITFIAASCGIDAQESAQPINPDVLDGLDQTVPPGTEATGPSTLPAPTATAPASTVGAGSEPSTADTASMYYIEGPALVPVVEDVDSDLSLRSFLGVLENGPPEEAAETGIRSAIPDDLIMSVRVLSDSVTVDFDPTLFQAVDARDRPLLIGQVVLTLTKNDLGYSRVRFTLGGEPLEVPRRDGTLTNGTEWVTAHDYEQLVAE